MNNTLLFFKPSFEVIFIRLLIDLECSFDADNSTSGNDGTFCSIAFGVWTSISGTEGF